MFGWLKTWWKKLHPAPEAKAIRRTFGATTEVRQLTEEESAICEVARSVFSDAIVAQGFKETGDDVSLVLELRNAKYRRLATNLSNLARKYRDGVSLDEIQASYQAMLQRN